MGLKCHLPLTHRQCDPRAGPCSWNPGVGCQLPDTSPGVSTDRAGLEAPEESTELGDEACDAWGAGEGHKA